MIIRDYGIYDQAQLRFKPGHKLQENLYVRQDGTLALYFSTEMFTSVFESAGFMCENVEYIFKELVNRRTNVQMDRVFVQGRFIKPQ